MPGPLPKPDDQRARRNAPTIPTTNLPAGGYQEPTPDVPEWIDLGMAGRAWWEWAWHTPQAAAWDDGQLVTVARRASLEDDLRIVNQVDNLDFLDVLDIDSEEAQAVRKVINRLAGMCIGRDKLIKRCDDLDDKLGLTPKGMAQLRWKVVADKPKVEPAKAGGADVITPDFKRQGS